MTARLERATVRAMSSLDVFFAVLVLLALFVAAGHLWHLVSALRPGGVAVAQVDRELIDLADRKAHLLEDLRDTELDYRMSKIGQEEYLSRKRQLEPEAVAVIKELERRGVGVEPDDDDDEDEG